MSKKICDPSFGIRATCKYCGMRMIVHKCPKHKPEIPKECPSCNKKDWVKTKK